jgi:hypothetical protein
VALLMNLALQGLCQLFGFSLAASAMCAVFAYVLLRRRDLWFRFLDAEESFWFRFGLRKGGFTRRFSESRVYTMTIVFCAVILLLADVTIAALYFYIRYRSIK